MFKTTWKQSLSRGQKYYTSYLNIVSYFHEIFQIRVNFLYFHAVHHTVEFTKFLYHLKIISWNQLFSKRFTKEIVFTEIFQKVVIQKFCKIHSVSVEIVAI